MSLPLSLKETIAVRRKLAVRRVTYNTPFLALFAAGVAGLLPGPWWIWGPLAAWEALCIAANGWEIWNMHKAQQIYDGNPAAAYIAEMRKAFGITTY